MEVLLDDGEDRAWIGALAAALPGFDVVSSDDAIDPTTVTHVAMWNLSAERLATFTGLQAILLKSAGFNHLDLDRFPDVPIVRLIDPAMADDIALYVLSWVIHFQRDLDRYARLQADATWREEPVTVFARDFTVGVFGSGAIGNRVLEACAHHGFATIAWSRSDHDRSVEQFFTDCDVVIDLVPLSDSTRGVIGESELAALGDGTLINVGRGPTVDTEALLAALDGPLRAAVLDVFDTEPLPTDSPLWAHPKVTITPHVAGRSDPVTASNVIAASIAELAAGRQPSGLITLRG